MSDSFLSAQDISASHNGYPNGSEASFGQPHVPTVPIIRKKLMGYVGFANLPNQVHRKSVRKGFQFTTMVVGAFFHPFCRLLRLNVNPPRACCHASRRVWSWKVDSHQHPLQHHPISTQGPLGALRGEAEDGRHREHWCRCVYIYPQLRPRIMTVFILRIDIEENGVRLHLTVVDTPGFGDFVNNDDR